MKVRLIDVDSHNFPNLALMKLAAYHRLKGDDVDWYNPLFDTDVDLAYQSKVFTFTQDYGYPINAKKVVKGGTGYGIMEELPREVEYTFPDYSIYPQYKFAVGFLTRGCIRKCPWCIVPNKEGWIHEVNTWEKIKRPDSKDIVFLDNNALASNHAIGQMEDMIGQNVMVDFNQGLDARLLTKEIAMILSKLKWMKYMRFACDTSAMLPIIEQAVKYLGEAGVKPYKIFVYALIQDTGEALDRIKKLDKLGVMPFAQPYRDFSGGGEPSEEQKRLARWCNMKAVHRTTSYEDYSESKLRAYRNGLQCGIESQKPVL